MYIESTDINTTRNSVKLINDADRKSLGKL
jgi:hypothetical protein